MNNKNKLSYILSLYYRWEFIEIVERTEDNDYGTRTILVVREDKNYES